MDPEQLAENFAAEVRQVFLLQARRKSPTRSTATAIDSSSGDASGLPRTVRVLETVGRAMREMKSARRKSSSRSGHGPTD